MLVMKAIYSDGLKQLHKQLHQIIRNRPIELPNAHSPLHDEHMSKQTPPALIQESPRLQSDHIQVVDVRSPEDEEQENSDVDVQVGEGKDVQQLSVVVVHLAAELEGGGGDDH